MATQRERAAQFKLLIGQTIQSVDATAINRVRLTFESGKVFELDCDEQHYDIGIIQATEVK